MALKDVIEKGQADAGLIPPKGGTKANSKAAATTAANTEAAPAPAPAAPTPPMVGKGGKITLDVIKNQGKQIRSMMSEDEKAVEGSKSDTVAFVCALGNPMKRQDRKEKGASIESWEVCGYKFKALEDLVIREAPIREDYKEMVDVTFGDEKPIKAGEIFALNLVETAYLMSKVEYAGIFSGEGNRVALSARTSQVRSEPLPCLVTPTGSGSVKINMELVANVTGEKRNKTAIVKDEYKEKFGVLFNKKKMKRSSAGSSTKAGEVQANIAAAFRSLYASKM